MPTAIPRDYDSHEDVFEEESSQPGIQQQPERRLLKACFERAFKDIRIGSKHGKKALEWLLDNDDSRYPWSLSFKRDVAPELHLDIQATRKAVLPKFGKGNALSRVHSLNKKARSQTKRLEEESED